MQQQKRLPQHDNWQIRLAEHLASKEWKDNDPTLESFTQEEVVCFLLEQQQKDYPLQRQAKLHRWLLQPVGLFIFCGIAYKILKSLAIDPGFAGQFFAFYLLLSFVWDSPFIPRKLYAAKSRQLRLKALLPHYLSRCTAPDLIPVLLRAHTKLPNAQRLYLENALTRILIPLSGDAVFALPFELRAELAQLAEQRETPLELTIAILLALTSARDGNVQPVLRRLSKDARSPRLREVAAECLREFSASP